MADKIINYLLYCLGELLCSSSAVSGNGDTGDSIRYIKNLNGKIFVLRMIASFDVRMYGKR